jgi:energy-coupling factor transporter ATP-binding protein EcfA2
VDIPKKSGVRFLSLQVRDYGPFAGSHEWQFGPHQTVIVGGSGSGLTTIARALADLGPSPSVEAHLGTEDARLHVETITEGDRDLLRKYHDLVLIACDEPPLVGEQVLVGLVPGPALHAIQEAAEPIFRSCFPYPRPPLSEPSRLSAGEWLVLGYATALAARQVLALDLPLILDRPFAMLDKLVGQAVRQMLKAHPCQLPTDTPGCGTGDRSQPCS